MRLTPALGTAIHRRFYYGTDQYIIQYDLLEIRTSMESQGVGKLREDLISVPHADREFRLLDVVHGRVSATSTCSVQGSVQQNVPGASSLRHSIRS
jgi:hypothetical protein